MTEIFYITLLIIFGALSIIAFFSSSIRAVPLKEELERVVERTERLQERISQMREELRELELDIELLEDEKRGLEDEQTCMRKVQDAHLDHQLAKDSQ